MHEQITSLTDFKTSASRLLQEARGTAGFAGIVEYIAQDSPVMRWHSCTSWKPKPHC